MLDPLFCKINPVPGSRFSSILWDSQKFAILAGRLGLIKIAIIWNKMTYSLKVSSGFWKLQGKKKSEFIT